LGEEVKKYRGLDIKTLSYFCGDDTWKVNPEGHLPKYAEKVEKFVLDFEQVAKDLRANKISDKEAQKKAQGITKAVLELCLLPKGAGNPNGFDFKEALAKYGWRTMDGISIDLKKLFLEIGGLEEYKLLKQRLKEGKQNGYIGIEA